MIRAGSARLRPAGSRAALLLLLVAFTTGCGGERLAAVYRAERLLYKAGRAEAAARLADRTPDSTALMALREKFLEIRESSPGPYEVPASGEARERALSLLRVVGSAESQAARLALEANRPDLTIEGAERLEREAAADSSSARQAAFMRVAALQRMGRVEDAVAAMKGILERFPPQEPSPAGEEDPVLALPEAIVNARKALGDEEAASRERRAAADYYEKLLRLGLAPRLEAQIRARLLRTTIELDQPGRALDQVVVLERLVGQEPDLKPLLPEVLFAKGRIRLSLDRDPEEGIAILERLAVDFPASPLAPRALFEIGAALESRGNRPAAKERYEVLLQRFPKAEEVGGLALLRLAIMEERRGEWVSAKRTLESIPRLYPGSQAAAEAPMAVIEHYWREGFRTAAKNYLSRASETYHELLARDPTGKWAPLLRFKTYHVARLGRDSTAMYSLTEEMLRRDLRHPFTGQVVLGTARASVEFGNPARGAGYVSQYLEEFPRSPLADQMRQELRRPKP